MPHRYWLTAFAHCIDSSQGLIAGAHCVALAHRVALPHRVSGPPTSNSLGEDLVTPELTQPPGDFTFYQNPYPFYERLRAQAATAPGRAVRWTDYDLFCFAGQDDVNSLLRDKRFGRQILHVASREELGWAPLPAELEPFYAFERHSLLETEPPDHTRLRRLVNRGFVGKAVADIRPVIRAVAHELIDQMEQQAAHGPVDLLKHFCEPLPVHIITKLLGVPAENAGQLVAWSHQMVAMYEHNRDKRTEQRAVAATIAFSAFMKDVIKDRLHSLGDDLLSALIRAQEADAVLSEAELITTAILLLNAGHEATVHALGNGIKALLEHQLSGQELFADPEIAAQTSEEILRFDPPLHLFTRYVLEDLDWSGLKLKRGQQVGLLIAAANRDPGLRERADAFDPGRTATLHMALGAGIHFCVGAALARAELQEGLAVLFARLPNLQLAKQPTYADRYHFHGLTALEVVI